MSDGIPESPFSQPNYKHDLELAMMARAAYASRDEILGSMTGSFDARDKQFTVPMNWELLNKQSENFIDSNNDTGFVAVAFKHQEEKRIVIAFRGSDNLKDWDVNGPNVLLGADGDLLADQVKFGLFRFGEHPREQISRIQERLLPNGNQQFRQFAQALEYVAHIQKMHPEYDIEVTGHSLGGSLAQVSSHTFGLHGRAFDPAGAENIVESEMYKNWLKKHDIAPAGVPVSNNPSWETSFVNYKVNDSIPSHRTGQHLGGEDSLQKITALGGREGTQDYVSYGLSKGSDVIGKIVGGSALLKIYNRAALEAQDVTEKHNMDRIIRVFEHAVEEGKLQEWGQVRPYEFDRQQRTTNVNQDVTPNPPTTQAAHGRALKPDPRNANHPDHALYAALQQRLPPQTSDDTVAYVMLQAKIGGVRNERELDKVIVQDGRAFVMGTTPGFRTAVDLSQIPPPMQETTQRSVALDQQHAMQCDQWLAQDQTQSRGMHPAL